MEKIKIFHSADAHGDMEAIKVYSDHIKEQKPDIAFLTGDLIQRVYTKEQLEEYFPIIQDYEKKKYNLLKSAVEGLNILGSEEMKKLFSEELFCAIQNGLLEDKSQIELLGKTGEYPSTKDLTDLLKNPATLPSVGAAIEPYLKAREYHKEPCKIAKQNMESQYKEIARILEGLPCLVLPGNHDGKCLEEIMGRRNIHKNRLTFKGIEIAGYGSAKGTPLGIPRDLLKEFPMFKCIISQEDKKIDYEGSEAGAFMIHKDPDIAVLHETPFTDEGIKSYITTEQPYLVLAGHLHQMIGASDEISKDSLIVMPGKLGIIPTLEGGLTEVISDGNLVLTKAPKDEHALLRTFIEIEIEKEESETGSAVIQKVNLQYKQIKGGKVESFN